MSELLSFCGGCGSGEGDFVFLQPDGCAVEATEAALLEWLDLLSATWEGVYRVGLFKSDAHPSSQSTLAQLVPCDFSGYGAIVISRGWSAAVIDGKRAITEASPIRWTHNGGPINNDVYGYYVVDSGGSLRWAERFCPSPRSMNGKGLIIRVIPRYTQANEFKPG